MSWLARAGLAIRPQEEERHRAYVSLEELIALRYRTGGLALRPDRRLLRQNLGGQTSRIRGRGMDFAEFRLYQPGDDIRNIDWRVTARRGKAHTKVFEEERERPVLLLVDQSRSLFFGSRLAFKSVRAAELAALLSWGALAHGDRVGGLVFSHRERQELRPARSQRAILQLLQLVADYNGRLGPADPAPQSFSLNQALAEMRRIAKPGSLVVVISDFLDHNDDTYRHLHLLARHSDLFALRIQDPLEAELPPPGLYAVSDGRSRLRLDTSDRRLREAYQRHYQERQQALRERLAHAAIPLLDLSTQQDPLEALRTLLTRT